MALIEIQDRNRSPKGRSETGLDMVRELVACVERR